MKPVLHSLLVALMFWLPLSQAADFCCPAEQPMPEHRMMMAMEDCAGHAETAGTASADCQGECVQLGQVAVPVLAPVLGDTVPRSDLQPVPSSRIRPAHQHPLLRPPRLIS